MSKKRSRFLSVVVSLILLISAAPALAGWDDWKEITEADWAVTQDSAREIFDAVILFEEVTADHKKLMQTDFKQMIYRRIRILGPNGREWADVEAPFLDIDQKVKEIKGRTILPDGTIIELDKDKIFEKEAFKSKGEDYTQYTFSLPGVTEDCIVEYVIRYELDTWIPEWLIQKDIPQLRFQMNWILPQYNFTVTEDQAERLRELVTPNYLWLNTHSPIKVDQLPNLKAPEELRISCGFVPAFKSEPHTVPDKALKTKLYTYYGSRVPPATYWGQEATDLIELLDDFSDDNKRLRKVVERFADLPTEEEKIAAAYNWLRDSILNLNYFDLVEWDDGRRKSKEPDDIETADDLFKHRYGWRIDIDKAFADMLREMNIDARYCYAKDRFDDLLVTDAKYWQLDRSLVAVPTAEPGKYTFYTVGHACTPIEKAPWFLEGVQALIGGGRDLMVPIPFSPPDYSITQTMYNVEITEDLEAFGTMSSRLTGHDAYDVRITLVDEDTADFGGLLKEEAEASYPDAKVDSITVDQLDDLTEPVLVACRLTYPELTTAGSRILLKPFDYCSSVENPFYAPERKNAILFNWAYELKESAHLVLPEGYVIEALPADTTFENVTGRCMIGFQQMGNTLVAQRFFRLKHPFWNVADYPALQELFQARQDLSGQVVVLKEGEFIDESDSELEAPIEPKVTEPAEKTTGL